MTDHNAEQVAYFTDRPLPRMEVDDAASPYVRRHVDAVLAGGRIRPDDRILDVGCGPGKYTLALVERGLDVEGLDLTPALLDRLGAAAPDLPLHLADLGDPPEALTGRFDVVTGFFMLHHISDLARAFAGVRTVLRPGGRAVFCEPNPAFLGYYAQITLTPGMTWRGDGGILRMWPRTIGRAARSAGLVDVTADRFGALPPGLANRPWGPRLEDALEAVPGWHWARAFQLFTMRAP